MFSPVQARIPSGEDSTGHPAVHFARHSAGVAKRQTQRTQNAPRQPLVRVRIPLPAPPVRVDAPAARGRCSSPTRARCSFPSRTPDPRSPDARKRSLAAPPPCVPYMRNPGVEEGGATSRRVPLAGTWSIAIVRGVVCQRRVGANPDSCRSIVVEPGDEHASSCSIGAVPLNRRGVS